MPFSDAKEGPFSRLTESGKAIVDTLADGINRAQPLKVALMAGALALPQLDTLALGQPARAYAGYQPSAKRCGRLADRSAARRPFAHAARLGRRAAGSGTRAGRCRCDA